MLLNSIELKEELKRVRDNRASSASTNKSIKFNDNDAKDSSSGLSSILKSRPSTRMSGKITVALVFNEENYCFP